MNKKIPFMQCTEEKKPQPNSSSQRLKDHSTHLKRHIIKKCSYVTEPIFPLPKKSQRHLTALTPHTIDQWRWRSSYKPQGPLRSCFQEKQSSTTGCKVTCQLL